MPRASWWLTRAGGWLCLCSLRQTTQGMSQYMDAASSPPMVTTANPSPPPWSQQHKELHWGDSHRNRVVDHPTLQWRCESCDLCSASRRHCLWYGAHNNYFTTWEAAICPTLMVLPSTVHGWRIGRHGPDGEAERGVTVCGGRNGWSFTAKQPEAIARWRCDREVMPGVCVVTGTTRGFHRV